MHTNNIKSGVSDYVDTTETYTKVRMVSYSMPAKEYVEEGLKNVQDLIAYCARVSNPSNQFNKETADNLELGVQAVVRNKAG